MGPLFVLVAVAATGIEVGWEPLPAGGHEYTIQIEPQLLEYLQGADHEIVSDVPAQLDVRRYRILVGTGKLARVVGEPRQPSAPVASRAPQPAASQPELEREATPHDSPGVAQSKLPQHAPAQPAEPIDESLLVPPHESYVAEQPTAAGQHASPDHEPPHSGSQGPDRPTDAHVGHEPGHGSARPAILPAAESPANPLRSAKFETSEPVHAQKPAGSENHASEPAEPPRPWIAFLVAMVLLCCSLGANVYLSWIARDARARYRDVVARYRIAPAS